MKNNDTPGFMLDGAPVSFQSGDTIMTAATRAGAYIPHLCHHQDLSPHGSCRVCLVRVNGKIRAACITAPEPGARVENTAADIVRLRRRLVQMLFVEGNHFCPSCEVSGQCQLQGLAYDLGMLDSHFDHFYPGREIDCSHPDIVLDRDRCINCALCVRASDEADGKQVFSLGGRGQQTRLQANSASGRLADTAVAITDKSQQVCPVGALLPKTGHYRHISGERVYDQQPIHIAGHVRPDMGEDP